ncbi:MAG: RluA family pseudouridine synthase [Clostridia bacterium]|nr:RluA family pseudouridine synthase [Clostridia bacterium]
MKTLTIGPNDAGQRLDKFLTKSLPTLPQALLYKYIRLKRIKRNGRRTQISDRLQAGDTLELYINDEFFEKPRPQYDFLRAAKTLDILYEDENLLLLNKKVGLLSHPDETEYVDTLITRVKRYLYEKGEYDPDSEQSFTPSLVNRIDRNTCGIVMAAKNAEALRALNAIVKSRQLHKMYLCVVHGRPPREADTLEGYLRKDEAKNKVFVSRKSAPDAKEIRTRYRVLDSYRDLSLLEVELLTGRTHQIRAHLASVGCPLLGDGKYGTNAQNKRYGYKKQFLCSYKLTFDFTEDVGALQYLDKQTFALPDVWFETAFRDRSLWEQM